MATNPAKGTRLRATIPLVDKGQTPVTFMLVEGRSTLERKVGRTPLAVYHAGNMQKSYLRRNPLSRTFSNAKLPSLIPAMLHRFTVVYCNRMTASADGLAASA